MKDFVKWMNKDIKFKNKHTNIIKNKSMQMAKKYFTIIVYYNMNKFQVGLSKQYIIYLIL
jgi:hypothetical protein